MNTPSPDFEQYSTPRSSLTLATSTCLSTVVAIFTRSRKMASLPPDRRRKVGATFHEAMSISQIATFTVKALETSVAFQGPER